MRNHQYFVHIPPPSSKMSPRWWDNNTVPSSGLLGGGGVPGVLASSSCPPPSRDCAGPSGLEKGKMLKIRLIPFIKALTVENVQKNRAAPSLWSWEHAEVLGIPWNLWISSSHDPKPHGKSLQGSFK